MAKTKMSKDTTTTFDRALNSHNKLLTQSFILVFFLVYFNLSSLAVTLRMSNAVYAIGSFLFFFAVFIWNIFRKRSIKFNYMLMLLCITMILIILCNMLLNQDNNILNFVIILQIIVMFLLSSFMSFEDFAENFVKVMLFLCIYSLVIMYIIVPFIPIISSLFPIRVNETGLQIRDYIFGFHFVDHSVAMRRNTAIFREMGVFQFYSNLALIFELFVIKRSKKRYFIITIFIVTTLSTFSTTGILQLITIIFAYLLNNADKKKYFKEIFKLLVGFLLLFLTISIISPQFRNSIELALMKFSEGSGSYEGRTSAIISNLNAWADSPVFGNGINAGIQRLENLIGHSAHNTSTTTAFLDTYGLFFTLIISFPVILMFLRFKSNKIVSSLLIFGFFLSINSERLIYDQFFYVVSFCYFFRVNSEQKRGRFEKGHDNSSFR